MFICFVAQHLAQTASGSLVGIVADPYGAVVPGAAVRLTDNNTGVDCTAVANVNGKFTLGRLPSGHYRVSVEGPRFKMGDCSDCSSADVQLSVGETSKTVKVTGKAAFLKTDSADLSSPVEAVQIQDLPKDRVRIAEATRRRRAEYRGQKTASKYEAVRPETPYPPISAPPKPQPVEKVGLNFKEGKPNTQYIYRLAAATTRKLDRRPLALV
jgi:hypothetical protein